MFRHQELRNAHARSQEVLVLNRFRTCGAGGQLVWDSCSSQTRLVMWMTFISTGSAAVSVPTGSCHTSFGLSVAYLYFLPNLAAFRVVFWGILWVGSVTLHKQFLFVKEGRPPQGRETDSEMWVRSLFIHTWLLDSVHECVCVSVCVGEWTLGSSSLSLCVWNMGNFS